MPAIEPTSRTTATRTESDSLGSVAVPAERYWGAQTQRSLVLFSIGEDRMPAAVIYAHGHARRRRRRRTPPLVGWIRDPRERSSRPRRR
jgi:fumarate hydratase, class II